jgi:hypothetical protein
VGREEHPENIDDILVQNAVLKTETLVKEKHPLNILDVVVIEAVTPKATAHKE